MCFINIASNDSSVKSIKIMTPASGYDKIILNTLDYYEGSNMNILFMYIAIGVCCVIALLILLAAVDENYLSASAFGSYYKAAAFAVIVAIMAEVLVSAYEITGTPLSASYVILNAFGFSITPWIPVLISHSFGNYTNKLLKIMLVLPVFSTILSLISPLTASIFHICGCATYSRGNLFVIFVIAYIYGMVLCLIRAYKFINSNQGDGKHRLASIFIFTVAGTVTQIAFPNIHLSWLTVTFALYMLYAYSSELRQKTDPLTGLYNRFAYDFYLSAYAEADSFMLMIIDIDDFKRFNDAYGHQCGDEILKTMSTVIKSHFFPFGKCFRIGGDEFAILTASTDYERLESIAADCINEISKANSAGIDQPSFSYGWSICSENGKTVSEAINEADQKMYLMKSTKKYC